MTGIDWRVDSMAGLAPGYFAAVWRRPGILGRWQTRLYRLSGPEPFLVMEGDHSTIQAAKDAADKAMADDRAALTEELDL